MYLFCSVCFDAFKVNKFFSRGVCVCVGGGVYVKNFELHLVLFFLSQRC